MEVKDINFNCFDNPTQSDYKFEWEDMLSGINSKRPKDKIKVQDQKQTPACTFYSAYHVINGYNLLEDERQGIDRPQIDPLVPRNEFCKYRGNYTMWYSIQWAATEAKKAGKIIGRLSIGNELSNDVQVEKMKKALDSWYFMNTGSSNGDRQTTGSTGTYTLRTDTKFVWHARSIIDYDTKWFIAINSRGIRWKELWYFHVPFNLVDKLYSKLVIMDTDDSWYFQRIKERSQAMDAVRQLKKIYALSLLSSSSKDMCGKIATELRNIYGFTDKDL